MVSRQIRRRAWEVALDRFGHRLRTKIGMERNNYLRQAAAQYEAHQAVPSYVENAHRNFIREMLVEHYGMTTKQFGIMALRQVREDLLQRKDYFTTFMQEWIETQGFMKSSLIASTDTADVQQIILAGINAGDGVATIAARLRELTASTPWKAAMIARTETHAAATFGSIETIRKAEEEIGIPILKTWLPTRDHRTRDNHAAMINHPAIPLQEKFKVGSDLMDRPGDPNGSAANVINCRCALIYQEQE